MKDEKEAEIISLKNKLNLKLPKHDQFTLRKTDIFNGETLTVMKPPSKEGSKKWTLAQEEFYMNPDMANIYDIKFNVRAITKGVHIDFDKYTDMLKSSKQRKYEKIKSDAKERALRKLRGFNLPAAVTRLQEIRGNKDR